MALAEEKVKVRPQIDSGNIATTYCQTSANLELCSQPRFVDLIKYSLS